MLMDTTPLDVFDGSAFPALGWVQLTVAMDWYSRCITGLRLTPVSTKAVDAAAVLYQSFRPGAGGRDWPAEAVWPPHGAPARFSSNRMSSIPPACSQPTLPWCRRPWWSITARSMWRAPDELLSPTWHLDTTGASTGSLMTRVRSSVSSGRCGGLLQELPGYKGT